MKMIYIIIIIASISLFGADAVKTFHTGDTYKFAENNMLEDIQSQIKNNTPQIKKKLEEIKKGSKKQIKNFKPKDIIALKNATKNDIFYPNMRYINPKNIYDNDGKVIYPKGFTFNPLDFQTIHYQIIVIDGSDKKELDWLIKNNYTDNIKYKILLTDGNYRKVSKLLKQPVFYCLANITKKFKLKYTPSIITQIGNKMQVKEICLKCKK